jgi:hypothetical protein
MAIKLDPDVDLETDVDELQREFKRMAPLIHAWSEVKAASEEAYEISAAEHKELRAQTYLDLRAREGKITEATLAASIDVDPAVKKSLRNMLEKKKDFETLRGFVEGLRAKKDMLVQLGADARKE